MDDWTNHNHDQPHPSNPSPRCHVSDSPDMEDDENENHWMEEDDEQSLNPEGAWAEDDGQARGGAEFGGGEDDVYSQLAQKEQDLMLAAELGNALLEKNQELEEQVARLTEDFGQKLEVLEQERHSLQSQLTQRQAEYENTSRDLQDDVTNLQEQLRHHDDQSERKHVQDVRKLRLQNEQLSEQLRQSLAQQQALSAEAGHLREQLTSRRSTLHQRVDHVDQLEDKVVHLKHRHQELEVQIRQVKEERDALATELDSLHERLLLLEKQRRMQDEQLHHQTTELQELRDTNSLLQSQLQQVTSRGGSHHDVTGDSPTLFSELSHLNDLNISPPAASFIQFHNGERMTCLAAEMLEEDDFEYDDDIFCDVTKHSSPVPPNLAYHGNSLQEEMMRCGHAPLRMDTSSSREEEEDDEGEEGEGAGGGSTGTEDTHLRGSPSKRPTQLRDLLSSDSDDGQDGGRARNNASFRAEKEHHVIEMTCDPRHLYPQSKEEDDEDEEEEDTISRHCQHQFSDMLQAQQSRIDTLECRVQELESHVQELQRERDRLQDAACGHVTADHVLQQTRSERDHAMSRISDMEGELSRLTQEVVKLNGQLMDTFRRKVRIFQELDQWKVDLNEVLAAQMQRRASEQQKVEKTLGQLQRGVNSDRTPPNKKQDR